jgi:hypothetical protein
MKLKSAGLVIWWAAFASLALAADSPSTTGGSTTTPPASAAGPADTSATAPAPAPAPTPAPQAAAPQDTAPHAPLQLQLGNITIMPVGFMDATAVWRSVDAGSSIGSSFGSIPYNTALTSKLDEFRFSIQNSRIGFRVDGNWKGWHFIGYNEFDFLGSSASNAIGVTNGAFVPRIRLYWLDARKDKFEFLAGQSWSMLTPNRVGISALPSDLFYSQVVDVNYVVGLTWTRQTGVRFLYHPNGKVTMGLSLENPDQYIGGSAGGPQIVLPAALSAIAGAQLDNTSANYLSTPNPAPDIIAKVAFDPTSRVHFEVAGLDRTFKIVNPTNLTASSTKEGVGGSVNANFAVVKNFRLVTNNFWSNGGGRYLFGQAPDVIVRANGTLSPVHSGGVVEGFEANPTPKLLVYGYYGAVYVGRNVALDANGTSLVGYGYRGSANSQNRATQELTAGMNQTVWKDPRYGAVNLMYQYQYTTRDPWYVATGAPKNAHDNTLYFNVRYTLPGGAPPAEK